MNRIAVDDYPIDSSVYRILRDFKNSVHFGDINQLLEVFENENALIPFEDFENALKESTGNIFSGEAANVLLDIAIEKKIRLSSRTVEILFKNLKNRIDLNGIWDTFYILCHYIEKTDFSLSNRAFEDAFFLSLMTDSPGAFVFLYNYAKEKNLSMSTNIEQIFIHSAKTSFYEKKMEYLRIKENLVIEEETVGKALSSAAGFSKENVLYLIQNYRCPKWALEETVHKLTLYSSLPFSERKELFEMLLNEFCKISSDEAEDFIQSEMENCSSHEFIYLMMRCVKNNHLSLSYEIVQKVFFRIMESFYSFKGEFFSLMLSYITDSFEDPFEKIIRSVFRVFSLKNYTCYLDMLISRAEACQAPIPMEMIKRALENLLSYEKNGEENIREISSLFFLLLEKLSFEDRCEFCEKNLFLIIRKPHGRYTVPLFLEYLNNESSLAECLIKIVHRDDADRFLLFVLNKFPRNFSEFSKEMIRLAIDISKNKPSVSSLLSQRAQELKISF